MKQARKKHQAHFLGRCRLGPEPVRSSCYKEQLKSFYNIVQSKPQTGEQKGQMRKNDPSSYLKEGKVLPKMCYAHKAD